jgi:hypothetical protein
MKRLLLAIFTYCSIIMSSTVLAYDPVDCLQDAAKADQGISVGLATKLCAGASSPAVVQCYSDSFKVDNGMSRGIAIDLCAGSTDAQKTLACYVKASQMSMTRGQAKTLCGAREAS